MHTHDIMNTYKDNTQKTRTNPHEHWSRRLIRRSVPVDDDWQMLDQKRHERKSCKGTLTLTQKPRTPRNKQSDTVTVGTTTNRSTTLLGASNCIYPIQGSFTLPCIPFYPFHLRDLSTGAFVQTEVQIQKPTSKNNPHLFPLHHGHIGPTPSQTHRYYFLICKNLEPSSYKQTSISRYHPMYTENQSRELLSHQKHC